MSKDVQEEQKSGPWLWKVSVHEYREIPEHGSRNGWMGQQGQRRGLMGLLGSGEPRKGKSFEM